MALTQAEYVEKVRAMFLSAGWLQVYKPMLLEQRAQLIDEALNQPDWEHTLAARQCVRLMDNLLHFETRVANMEKELEQNPDEANAVVESTVERNSHQ